MISQKISALLFITLAASLAGAQTQETRMNSPRISNMNVNDPVGWFPFLGVSGGSLATDSGMSSQASATDVKLLGSYFSTSRLSVVDVGLGFSGDSFTQKSATQNNFVAGGVVEAAWRYNFINRWQVGPIADVFVGGARRLGSTDDLTAPFAGVQVLKEIPIQGTNMFRVGLKGMTSLSVPKPENLAMLDLQWGFGAEQAPPDIAGK